VLTSAIQICCGMSAAPVKPLGGVGQEVRLSYLIDNGSRAFN